MLKDVNIVVLSIQVVRDLGFLRKREKNNILRRKKRKLYFEEKKFQPARSLSWAPGECQASPAFPQKGRAAQASQSLPPQRSQRISRSRGSAKNYFTEIDAEKFKAVFIYYEQFKAVFIYLFKAYFS